MRDYIVPKPKTKLIKAAAPTVTLQLHDMLMDASLLVANPALLGAEEFVVALDVAEDPDTVVPPPEPETEAEAPAVIGTRITYSPSRALIPSTTSLPCDTESVTPEEDEEDDEADEAEIGTKLAFEAPTSLLAICNASERRMASS